jgi:hypothetical protein
MSDAFYLRDGERFVPTDWTRGPWDPNAQHAGPPAALLGRAVEALNPIGEMQVARFTLEVLRPIPLIPLKVEARILRPGRRVQFAEATLSSDEGPVARASVWRIRPGEPSLSPAGLDTMPPPGPDASQPEPMFDPWGGPSYFASMEWRAARGSFFKPGPAADWIRMRIPLVPEEEPSPLTRVLAAADSGNGISMELPLDRYISINTELTVHLIRMPDGEWVCLDAITRIDPRGIGLAQSAIWDERGRIGSGNQSLVVAPR